MVNKAAMTKGSRRPGGMSLAFGTKNRSDEMGRNIYEDASLFMWFVNAVNSGKYIGREIEVFSTLSKRSLQHKTRFKTYSMNVDNFINERRDGMSFEEDRNGFVCAHCDARYVYKRCLINHLIKSHHTGSDILSGSYQ